MLPFILVQCIENAIEIDRVEASTYFCCYIIIHVNTFKSIFYFISNNIMFGIHLQSKKICIRESNAVNCKHIRNVYKYFHTQLTFVVFSSTQQRQQIWWYFILYIFLRNPFIINMYVRLGYMHMYIKLILCSQYSAADFLNVSKLV